MFSEYWHLYSKKGISLLKSYRLVIALLVVSKVYERIMPKQILEYIEKHSYPHLCEWRKVYSTQTAVIHMFEMRKLYIDNKEYAWGVPIFLIKAFDTINYRLLLAKLHPFEFRKWDLAILCTYLSSWKEAIKTNNVSSSWKDLILVVLQESVLAPLFFNIYLNDLFFLQRYIDIFSFAHDTTTYICEKIY